MNPKVALLAQQYRINRLLVSAALKDLAVVKIEARIGDEGNSMKWLVGHLASSRYVLARHLGVDEENPYGGLFARGAEVKPESAYPSLEAIRTAWEDIAEKVERRLEKLSDDDLAAPLEGQYPINDGTIMSAIAFLSLHESYHVGQLAYIRRLHGRDGIVG